MFKKEVYIQRRKQLKELLKGGIILLPGNVESPMNYPDNTYHFRQDSDFLYFFGLKNPGFFGLIDIEEDKEIIFGDDFSIDDIIWMGPQPKVQDLANQCGITETYAFSKVFEYLNKAIQSGRKIHFLPPYRAENKILLDELLGIKAQKISNYASIELIKAVVKLRSVKDTYEIAYLDAIMDVAYEMHTTAMRLAQAGKYEHEISGVVEGITLAHDGLLSFPIILSKNGETLHNHYHGNKLSEGDLLLVDTGFDSPMGYATDHTRTCPVGGKFTQKQKDIYQIVLDANNAARKITAPGILYRDCHLKACEVIADGLIRLGLMKGNIQDAVNAGAHKLFMPHGLGHMMGLDVHDMEGLGEDYVGYDNETKRHDNPVTAGLRMGRKLQEGFVITNEPGIYFIPALIAKYKKDGICKDFYNFDKIEQYIGFGGIRLEDDILITSNGCRILGKERIPITIEEVEAITGKGL